MDSLDVVYRNYLTHINETNVEGRTYNWCNCGIKNLYIVAGVLGGIVGCACCMCCVGWCMAICRKKSAMKESN